MEMQYEIFEELQDEIDELDSTDPECLELMRTLKVCQEMTYAIAEGFIEVEEDDEEEFRLFPSSALIEA